MLHHLKPYVTFQTVEEMDEHIRQHLKVHTLTKAQLAILYCIAGHALATPGVAHLKAETIAKKCAISTKTVYRAVKVLQQLGMLKRIASTKLNGIKAANIYVVNPYVPSEMSERVQSKERCGPKDEVAKYEGESISLESKTSSKEIERHENEFHDRLQDYFHYLPLRQPMKQQLQQVIPKLNIYTNTQYERAKKIVTECVFLVANHQITLYSSFENFVLGAYKKWTLHENLPEQSLTSSKKPVPFSNWLKERV